MAVRFFHKCWKWGLIPPAYYFLRFYLSLVRLKVINEEPHLDYVEKGGKIIVGLWHQRFLPTLLYASNHRRFHPCVMISQSGDGDIIAPIVQRLGLFPVRGSSSRGGRAALTALVTALSQNPTVAHIVDGPRGPKGVVKPGIIKIAQHSGAVIVPLYISVKKAWIAKSWDRFIIPKPFTKVMIRWGDAITVPEEIDNRTFEDLRKNVEQMLREGYARDDLQWGWKDPL